MFNRFYLFVTIDVGTVYISTAVARNSPDVPMALRGMCPFAVAIISI